MTAGRYSDREIIELIQNGGDDLSIGMRHLYITYRERLIRYLINRVRDENEAEEIFHESILRLIENIMNSRFNETSSLYTYLTGIASNLCLKYFSRGGKIQKIQESELEQEESPDISDKGILDKEVQKHVHRAMSVLNENEKQVVLLHYRAYSMREIAAKLGYKNETVVRNIKRRAMKKLADFFGKNPGLRDLFD